MIPNGVILLWLGANNAIPTGWQREISLDGKFPKAWGLENPNITGGSNTHSHSGIHSHALNNHAHSVTLNDVNVSQACDSGSGSSVAGTHGHNAANTNTTTGGSTNTNNDIWLTSDNVPPFYGVIFVKPSNTISPIKTGLSSFYSGSELPLSWRFCNGENGTPDLRNKFIRGASASSDAGEIGGSNYHGHNVTHGHTANPHAHTGVSNVANNGGKRDGSGDPVVRASQYHTHTIALTNVTDTVINYTNTNAGISDNVEPAHKKISVIKSDIGVARKGLIGLWLGSVASIPKNWVLCDGNNGTIDLRDKFLKIGNDLSENGQIGGSNTHSHTPVAHTHNGTSHSHSGSHGATSSNNGAGGQGDSNGRSDHTHTLNVSSTVPTYASADINASTVDNQPEYRTAVYIQLNKLPVGGSMLMV